MTRSLFDPFHPQAARTATTVGKHAHTPHKKNKKGDINQKKHLNDEEKNGEFRLQKHTYYTGKLSRERGGLLSVAGGESKHVARATDVFSLVSFSTTATLTTSGERWKANGNAAQRENRSEH